MFEQYLAVWINALVILFSLASIIFALVVVWKVERMLDTSFKLFLSAIIMFLISEAAAYFVVSPEGLFYIIEIVAKFFFALLFLSGMISMCNMIRHVEDELK